MGIIWPSTRLSLFLTMGCNFRCGHCVTESTPERMTEKMTPADVAKYLRQYHERGGRLVNFIGGEATLNLGALLNGISFCASHGIMSILTTNGWWGAPDRVHAYTKMFAQAGLTEIVCSFDQWHAAFQPWEHTKLALSVPEKYGIRTTLVCVSRHEGEPLKQELTGMVGPVGFRYCAEKMQRGSGRVVAAGRARNIAADWSRGDDYWLCHEIKTPGPFIGVLPGHRMWYRCDAGNPAMTHTFTGNYTELADSLEDTDFHQTLLHRGLIPLMARYKATEYKDHCQFCMAVMPGVRAEYG